MKNYITILVGAFVIVSQTYSQTNEEKGFTIAQEAEKRDNGWKSGSMDFSMILRNNSGQEITRKLHSWMLEVENDGDKSMVVFDDPADVKGTASLVYTHKIGDDDQWLYLPALKRVKRISSRNKSGPFMGSEFAYEDMASQEVEKFTYKFIGLSQANGEDSFLVERYPVDKNSGYSKQQVWFNKENYRIEKIDYYDRKSSLIKTLTYSGYNLYEGKFWRADEMLMKNHQTGKETLVKHFNINLDIGLSEEDFTQNSLRNAK